MWTTCESGSKDDCNIIFLYRGNLFFDEVEEVDGGEPEKEDEWVPTQEDYEHEKEDMALKREGMEGEEVEQDIDVEGVEQEEEKTEEITTKEKEKMKKLKKPKSQRVLKKKTMVGHDPKLYKQYQYHSTPTLGQLAKRKRMK